jgi:hypothetical protein
VRIAKPALAGGAVALAAVATWQLTCVPTWLPPPDRATTWAPGVPGGFPHRTTICATILPPAGEASGAINAAIASCPLGQVVQLQAGTYQTNDLVLLNRGVTLRGVGSATLLLKSNGAKPGVGSAAEVEPIVVVGPNRWPWPDDATARNLTSDAAKGATTVTLGSTTGFSPGQIVLIDEDHYTTAAWRSLPNRNGAPHSNRIWASDLVNWQRHDPPEAYVDDPFPAAASWFSRQNRPIAELKEIASVTSTTLTFRTPLHIAYRVSHKAQVTRWTGITHVRGASVEDLRMTGGSDGTLRFLASAYSWARNVEVPAWLGEGIAINLSLGVTVRDSYVHDAVWPNPGGGGYALSLANGSTDALVENNVLVRANKVMVARSAGAGSVVGYNYMDDGFIDYNKEWQEVGLNGSHMVGPHHMLFEGNQAFNYDSDNTHGSAIYHTVFRNHLTGFRRSYTGLGNGRTVGLAYGSYWHTIVGNVLGTPGAMGGWIYEDTATEPNSRAIWRLGYEAIHWEQDADPQVAATTIREGNWDYLRNASDAAPALALPSSLYLSTRPSWWPTCEPWPWVTPESATKLGRLPARARADGAPITCAAPTPTPTVPPTTTTTTTTTLLPSPTPTPSASPTVTPIPLDCFLLAIRNGRPEYQRVACSQEAL